MNIHILFPISLEYILHDIHKLQLILQNDNFLAQDMASSNSFNFVAQNIVLILLLFSSCITFISADENTNVEFVRSSCNLTTYPTLCFNSLSTKANAIQSSPKLLVQTALSVTLDTTKSTSSSIVKLSKVHNTTQMEVSALKDCIEMLSNSADELKRSLDEMKHPGSEDHALVMSDIQTWVSAAITDEDTCTDGFVDDPKMINVVGGKIVNVAHLISNALALINNYASLPE
ncbi:21 kDa protein-like [Rutidosis leptorrhynchoides]|uniref:21 kDa protein-like n=1 Tax=Rutidosis leptorrhynchoides TaxID=125765 RepID=UPI003A99E488